jgi:hypothetical protein
MEQIGRPEKSVSNHTPYNNPDEGKIFRDFKETKSRF